MTAENGEESGEDAFHMKTKKERRNEANSIFYMASTTLHISFENDPLDLNHISLSDRFLEFAVFFVRSFIHSFVCLFVGCVVCLYFEFVIFTCETSVFEYFSMFLLYAFGKTESVELILNCIIFVWVFVYIHCGFRTLHTSSFKPVQQSTHTM